MTHKPTEKVNTNPLQDTLSGANVDLPPLPEASGEDTQAQENRDFLNQLLGQVQMADAFAKFSVTVTTSKLDFVKENKLYRALKGKKSRNGYDFLKGTWEEFCGLLGISCEKADLDIANLHTFGEEALESMSRMGIGYRELRRFRKLPEDSRTALTEVAKEGDKESLLALAEELIGRQNREKETLEKQLINKAADLDASRRRVSELKASRDELEDRLCGERFKPVSDNELAERTRLEATSVSSRIVRELMGALQSAFTELEKDRADRHVDHSGFMAGLISEIRGELDNIITRFGIPDLVAEYTPPAWLNEHPAKTE